MFYCGEPTNASSVVSLGPVEWMLTLVWISFSSDTIDCWATVELIDEMQKSRWNSTHATACNKGCSEDLDMQHLLAMKCGKLKGSKWRCESSGSNSDGRARQRSFIFANFAGSLVPSYAHIAVAAFVTCFLCSFYPMNMNTEYEYSLSGILGFPLCRLRPPLHSSGFRLWQLAQHIFRWAGSGRAGRDSCELRLPIATTCEVRLNPKRFPKQNYY